MRCFFFVPMADSKSGGTKILLYLGLFVLATSFCHCTTLTRLKALDKLKENSTLIQGQAKGSGLCHGRLLIGQNPLQGAKLKGTKATKSPLDFDADYQADMGWAEPKHPKALSEGFSRLRPENAAVDRLLKMEPKVECTGDSMKLQVQDVASTPGALLFVDRGSRLSPLPLSKLPPSCGYTVRSTQRDLVLVAPYDGCFVALEEDSYVLPLRWWGVPVRMSCPLMRPSSPNPPMVTCHTEGMVVKTEWTVSVAKIKVNLKGNWEPLMMASPRCGFSVVVHPEGVVISVHYVPCLEKKDGMYTLELAGDGEIKISCPSLSPAQTETPSKGVPASTPSHNSGSGHAQKPSSQSAVPQVPGFPQNPEAPNKKPNQGPTDSNQPQLPYYPFYPHFFHPYPGTKPPLTVQPLPSPVTKKNDELQSQQTVQPSHMPVAPEGQVPQPFVPVPFYPWLAQPEQMPVIKQPPVQPQATQTPNGKVGNPFYPYPYYVKPPNTDVPPAHRPQPKPLPTPSPPVVQTTDGKRQQPYYPLPFHPQPPNPETPPTQSPVTKPPPGRLDEYFLPNPFNPPSVPPQKPVEPPASQPEKPKPFNPFPPYLHPPASEDRQVEQPLQPLYPETPGKPLPEKTVQPNPPGSQEPQQQIYQPFYHYPFYHPFWPQVPFQMHRPPTQQMATLAPKGQVQQPLSPLQPEASKPKVPGHLSPSKPLPAPESKEPSQPGAPQGQVHQYPYPLYPQPEPTAKPTTVQQPPQPEAPQGQVHQYPYPLYPFYPQPEPTAKPTTVQQQPPRPEAPQGQVHQYPYPLYPQPEPTAKPTTVQQPPQPEAPQGQVHQYPYPLYPFYPQPEPTAKPTTVQQQPPRPEAPQGQVHQYPYPLYPQPEPTDKPTTVQQPPQPEAPQGQVHQYPYPLYPQPDPTEKLTTVQQPPQPEAPWGQVHQLFYPSYPFYPQPKPENLPAEKPVPKPPYQQPYKIPGAGTNPAKITTDKPVPSEQPPGVKPPDGQLYHPFNLYYPQQPQQPQPMTLPPATSMQQPQSVTITQPSNGVIVPQGPQLGSPYMPSMYCPQFCPSGFSNCCPQIAFHQHHHHIVPAGLGSKDTPVHSALPFVPSVAFSGFHNGLGTALLPQNPTEATTTQASASTSPQPPPPGNKKQPYFLPPDGNPAVLSISKKPVNPQLPTYPYFVPNSLYPNWPYLPQSEIQNLPQSQAAADYNVPSKPQASGNDPVNPVVQYEPYYIQPPVQQINQPSPTHINNPSGPNLMTFIGQYQKQEHTANQQNEPTAKELQLSNNEFTDSKGQTRPRVQSELDSFLMPYYMLQDAQAPTYNLSEPQTFVSGSKSYVLLQHGPPGREPNSFHKSPLPFRDLVPDTNLLAQNLTRRYSSKPQHPLNFNPPMEKPPHLKWLQKKASPITGNANYILRPGDKSENLPVFASPLDGPDFLALPQVPPFSAAHLKPEFPESLKDMWKPITPVGSSRRIPADVPEKPFQQWSAAADHQTNGLNQAIQREDGNQRQK
ncbi:titin-like isoform X2 [Trachinotus anak]|uniref:titin-like isoform X2 n=1 Tax=Trachinotus anak TaxID=443729 RepID=UPI0039F1C48A